MAYADQPFGFTPVRHRNGASYNGAATPYWVDSSDSTALFIGDPVIIDGTSNTAEVEAPGGGKWPIGTLQGVTRATAGATNRVTGVVVGVEATDRDSKPYREASTERVVLVADDPDLVFMGQVDAALAAASVGLNANITIAAGSTSTGRSGAEVTATGAAADATFQTQILRFVNDPENEANAAGNRVEFVWALHTQVPAGGILGV